MKSFLLWLDDRTGFREILRGILFENIPGGARWRYVWGSTLAFAFFVQMITGIFLWMVYSPSTQSAWESVFYIEHEMASGALLRAVHHYMAQAMIVLLVFHLIQIVIDSAYKAPREFNFWAGLLMMLIILGLSLTGYLLPWDQKGYWATVVVTNISGTVPLGGPEIQKLAVGGSDYGHQTLTRFFALHAGVLPGMLVVLLIVHIGLFRRQGIHAKTPLKKPDSFFWPNQVLMDSVACALVLGCVLFLALKLGADLGAPADPAKHYSAARPEWYFLFLFQLLKYSGYWIVDAAIAIVVGAIVIPGVVMAVLFLMPVTARLKYGHVFNVVFLGLLLLGIVALTAIAISHDRNDEDHQKAVAQTNENAERAKELAREGIPPQGAAYQLRNDPKTQGPRLFRRYCASCHSHVDPQGKGIAQKKISASNLHRFASRKWITNFLDPKKINTPDFFGNTAHKFDEDDEETMANWVISNLGEKLEDVEEGKTILENIRLALSAEAQLPYQQEMDQGDAEKIKKGKNSFRKELAPDADYTSCSDCHKFHGKTRKSVGPDLTGYGSRAWLIEFISDPTKPHFYGKKNDRMPSFAKDQSPQESRVATPKNNRLSQRDLELIVDWLREDWYEPPDKPE